MKKIKHWTVETKDANTLLVTLKDNGYLPQAIGPVLTFYQLSMIREKLPLSPLLARFFFLNHTFDTWQHAIYAKFGRFLPCNHFQPPLTDDTFNFRNQSLNYPADITGLAIKTDFSKGILFKVDKDRDKHKLLALLERAFNDELNDVNRLF